uniref:8.9 kDa family member n=1 Tax=Rhipicephalus appendiculatus TaxID=34631 RepID=A0A131Z8V6_RHIAP
MYWATAFTAMALSFMLYSIGDFEAKINCTPPDCRKNRTANTTCHHPCVRYYCKNGSLTNETCPGENDPFCTLVNRGNGTYPDCCGQTMCTTSGRG